MSIKIDGNHPAFPVPPDNDVSWACGLTKREYFAAKALEGILTRDPILQPRDMHKACVDHADRLIAALNKEPAK